MPIITSTPIHCLSQDEFHAVDKVMMGHAFNIYNQYGRLLDEAVYKSLLAERCAADGVSALREVQVDISYGKFSKSYFVDLLLDGSTVIEVKTAKILNAIHGGQGINYLLLTGTRHGSLINFRTSKLEREFLSTGFTLDRRQSFQTTTTRWPNDADHSGLRTQIENLCSDIGLGLDITLYREALTVLLDLPRVAVAVLSGTSVAGYHEMSMLSPDIALVVTSLAKLNHHRHHLERLLGNTTLRGMTLVNLTLGQIHLEHISLSKI